MQKNMRCDINLIQIHISRQDAACCIYYKDRSLWFNQIFHDLHGGYKYGSSVYTEGGISFVAFVKGMSKTILHASAPMLVWGWWLYAKCCGEPGSNMDLADQWECQCSLVYDGVTWSRKQHLGFAIDGVEYPRVWQFQGNWMLATFIN